MIESISAKSITALDGKSMIIPAHKKVTTRDPVTRKLSGPLWLLVHDGKKVILLHRSIGGDTRTIHTVFESITEQGCLDEIKRLGLTYTPEGGVVKEVVKEPIPLDPELIK